MEATSGRPDASTTTIARASSAGAMPKPRPAPSAWSSGASAVTERRAGVLDLALGVVGRDLEAQPEATGRAELLEQVVEDGDAGRDTALAPGEVDPRSAGARHRSARSMAAPSSRNRSSMRS